MNDTDGLGAVEVLLQAVSDLDLGLNERADGALEIVGRLEDSPIRVEARRDLEPASEGDVRFIAAAIADLRRLLAAVHSGERIGEKEVADIRSRVAGASPGPWTAFIEAEGGQGGCDVIRVSEQDDQPDMYLWIGADLAPSKLFRVVAAARQNIPALLERVS